MKVTFLLALYGGPDQVMSVTSGLTAVFVFLLIFWNKVLLALGKILNLRRSGKLLQPARARHPSNLARELKDHVND